MRLGPQADIGAVELVMRLLERTPVVVQSIHHLAQLAHGQGVARHQRQ
ncbi:MAG: hypothetical protein ACPLXR_05630 [Halothiobacillaceae bacterium]